jgi:hypothetical protein
MNILLPFTLEHSVPSSSSTWTWIQTALSPREPLLLGEVVEVESGWRIAE